jgi:mono/diheme cytochrome c family protein
MSRTTVARFLVASFAAAGFAMPTAHAQDKPGAGAAQDKPATATQGKPAEAAPHPGKALLAAKCFQCHTDTIFRDQRQDQRAWEATLYRMVGRGALWTKEEIDAMAEYLAIDYGPQAPKPAATR